VCARHPLSHTQVYSSRPPKRASGQGDEGSSPVSWLPKSWESFGYRLDISSVSSPSLFEASCFPLQHPNGGWPSRSLKRGGAGAGGGKPVRSGDAEGGGTAEGVHALHKLGSAAASCFGGEELVGNEDGELPTPETYVVPRLPGRNVCATKWKWRGLHHARFPRAAGQPWLPACPAVRGHGEVASVTFPGTEPPSLGTIAVDARGVMALTVSAPGGHDL
jgi:hypothetical protein